MRSINVDMTLDAPPEPVFDVIVDHARYERFRDINTSELVREGDPPPNGVGALRKIRAGTIFRFEEEITHYERPVRMDYLIKKTNFPFEHQGGSIRLNEAGGGTQVEWTSTFRIPVPVVGGIQERILALRLARGFRRVLEDVERLLATED